MCVKYLKNFKWWQLRDEHEHEMRENTLRAQLEYAKRMNNEYLQSVSTPDYTTIARYAPQAKVFFQKQIKHPRQPPPEQLNLFSKILPLANKSDNFFAK